MVGWHHQLNGHEFEQTLGVLQFMGSQRVGRDLVTEQEQEKIKGRLKPSASEEIGLR